MLTESWTIVSDTAWEFTLRRGVKFHNGEPFTSASVKATIEDARDHANKSHGRSVDGSKRLASASRAAIDARSRLWA